MSRFGPGWIPIAVIVVMASSVSADEAGWKGLDEAGNKALADGQHARAEELLKRAVVEAEKLGPERAEVAEALVDLAHVYVFQEQPFEANILLERALGILAKTPGVAQGLLGRTYQALGSVRLFRKDYDEAETFLKRALAIQEKVLGADHPDLATPLTNLSVAYASKKKLPEAEAALRRALAIQEKALGTGHLKVASTLRNIAVLHLAEGGNARLRASLSLLDEKGPVEKQAEAELAEAGALLERAVAIREKALGPDDPGNVEFLEYLMRCYSLRQDHAHAGPLLRRVLAIREKTLGPEHPKVAETLALLAQDDTEQGKYREAIPLLRRAVAIREKGARTASPTGVAKAEEAEADYAGLLRKTVRLAEVMDDPDLRPTEADFRFLKDRAFHIGATDLAGLLDLTSLILDPSLSDNRPFNDSGLAHLRGLVNLERLRIENSDVTDAGLIHLRKLTDLTALDLTRAQVRGPGLDHLRGMTRLEELNLSYTRLDDVGLSHLTGLVGLRKLNLTGTKVSDLGVVHLKRLSGLKELELSFTEVSEEGVEDLKKALPGSRLSSNGYALPSASCRLRPRHPSSTMTSDCCRLRPYRFRPHCL